MENHGIPTKPAGGLQSDIGKVAPTHGQAGVPYWTTLKWFYVPPWAFAIHPQQAQARATISTIQQEWNLLPEGVRRVMRTTSYLSRGVDRSTASTIGPVSEPDFGCMSLVSAIAHSCFPHGWAGCQQGFLHEASAQGGHEFKATIMNFFHVPLPKHPVVVTYYPFPFIVMEWNRVGGNGQLFIPLCMLATIID